MAEEIFDRGPRLSRLHAAPRRPTRSAAARGRGHGCSTPACASCRAKRATAAPPPASRSCCASACRANPERTVSFHDVVYGDAVEIHRRHRRLRAAALATARPTYHMASCADDADLRITPHHPRPGPPDQHLQARADLRGARASQPPHFAHLPLLIAPDGAKLSKRKHGPVVSVTTYRDAGFLPHAYVNFLCLLGWSPKDDREVMTRQELIDAFTLEGVNRTNAIVNFTEEDPFDPKALWLNAEHICAMPVEELAERLLPFVAGRGFEADAAKMLRGHAADPRAHQAAARRRHRRRFLLRRGAAAVRSGRTDSAERRRGHGGCGSRSARARS